MSNLSVDTEGADFVLKHRIAGAAFLLVFGALVLPWLLGPPSDASEPVEVSQVGGEVTEEYIPKDLEAEILAQLQEEVVDDETVYISKVTPDGFAKVSETTKKSTTVKKVVADDVKKAEAELASKQKLDKKNAQAKLEKDKAAKLKAAKLKEQKTALAKAEAEKSKQEAAKLKSKVVEVKAVSDDERARLAEKQLSDALNAESQKNSEKDKSGWVVQVGVFTDKSGAQKVSNSLDENGFKPSSTVVDTNLGIGTGTRVWLGPYGSRDEASKVKVSLANKTGRSGFVRAYP